MENIDKTATGKVYGYARVSRDDQNPALQIDALKQAGCDVVFCDHGCSGAKKARPELDKLLSQLSSGDKLMVWKLDRLARSMVHLVTLLEDFGADDIRFESLTEKLDTATPYGEFVYHILAAMAQMERRLISERTKAGLEVARRNGKRLGRPPIVKLSNI